MRRWPTALLAATCVLMGACSSGQPSSSPSALPTSRTPTATDAPSGPSPTSSATRTATAAKTDPSQDIGVLSSAHAYLHLPMSGLTRELTTDPSCPMVADEDTVIAACVAAKAAGGWFAVTEEESTGKIAATLYALHDDVWHAVRRSEQYGPEVESSPFVRITPTAARFTRGDDHIIVEGLIGGSGAVAGYDLVTWSDGADEPRVIGHLPEAPHAVPAAAAGWFWVLSSNYDDGAPTCCPNFQDLRLVDLAKGRLVTTEPLPIGTTNPAGAALGFYRHWLDDNPGGAERFAAKPIVRDLFPGGAPDEATFVGCSPAEAGFVCRFERDDRALDYRLEPGGDSGFVVVAIEEEER